MEVEIRNKLILEELRQCWQDWRYFHSLTWKILSIAVSIITGIFWLGYYFSNANQIFSAICCAIAAIFSFATSIALVNYIKASDKSIWRAQDIFKSHNFKTYPQDKYPDRYDIKRLKWYFFKYLDHQFSSRIWMIVGMLILTIILYLSMCYYISDYFDNIIGISISLFLIFIASIGFSYTFLKYWKYGKKVLKKSSEKHEEISILH